MFYFIYFIICAVFSNLRVRSQRHYHDTLTLITFYTPYYHVKYYYFTCDPNDIILNETLIVTRQLNLIFVGLYFYYFSLLFFFFFILIYTLYKFTIDTV